MDGLHPIKLQPKRQSGQPRDVVLKVVRPLSVKVIFLQKGEMLSEIFVATGPQKLAGKLGMLVCPTEVVHRYC